MSYPLEPPLLGCGRNRVSLNTPSTLAIPFFCRHFAASSSLWNIVVVTAAGEAGAAAAADDGGVFFLKSQRCASLNNYSGGDGREAAPRGQIVGGVERKRCVEGRRLRAMGGGGGGRGDWLRQRIRSIFVSGTALIREVVAQPYSTPLVSPP